MTKTNKPTLKGKGKGVEVVNPKDIYLHICERCGKPYEEELQNELARQKKERIDLQKLSPAKRRFFRKTAGIFKFPFRIDIKKIYKAKIYD